MVVLQEQGSSQSTSEVPSTTSSVPKESVVSPSRRKEELHEKLALLNSRYVQSKGGSLPAAGGEKHYGEASSRDPNWRTQEASSKDPSWRPQEASSKVGLAAIQDMAALQEASLVTSEEVTPTNEFLPQHYSSSPQHSKR